MLIRKKNTAFYIAILCIAFILIYILNSLYPICYDDWCYAFIYGEKPLVKVTGITDVIQSQYNHYFQWGGRTVGHSIAQILIMLPAWLHDLLNTLAFVCLVFIVSKIANLKGELSVSVLILTIFLIYFFSPVFASTMLWITGSANYLWGTLITLLFIYFYCRKYIEQKKTDASLLKNSAFFLFGIIAGWTNENMSIAAVFMVICFCFLFRRMKILSSVDLSGMAGIIVGCAILLLSPGNLVRNDASYQDTQFTFFERILEGIEYIATAYSVFFLIISSIYIILLLTNILQNKMDWKQKNYIILSLLFVLVAHIALFALVALPGVHPRAFFGPAIFIIAGIIILYAKIQFNKPLYKKANIAFIIALCLAFGYSYYRQFPSYYLIWKTYDNRERYIKEQKKNGVMDFVFYDKLGLHYKFDFNDLGDDPDSSYSQYYSAYCGIRSIRVLFPEDK